MRCLRILLPALLLFIPLTAPSAELVKLTNDNWRRYAPKGKEVDCILGDFAFRSDRVVAVVAQPKPGRNANLTVHQIGGALIDLTVAGEQNDQLSCYYPGRRAFPYRRAKIIRGRGKKVILKVTAKSTSDKKPAVSVFYELQDGDDFLTIRTVFHNPSPKPIDVVLEDDLRMDRVETKSPKGETDLYWVHDRHFEQAYGVYADKHKLKTRSTQSQSLLQFLDPTTGKEKITLAPGKRHALIRCIVPGRHLLAVKAKAARRRNEKVVPWTFVVQGPGKKPVVGAEVILKVAGEEFGRGRSDKAGRVSAAVPRAKIGVTCKSIGRPTVTSELDLTKQARQIFPSASTTLTMEAASMVIGNITDVRGRPIPCKVAFKGKDGTQNPNWGPPAARQFVLNLAYSINGKFQVPIKPGDYEATITYGPEYDLVRIPVKVEAGKTFALNAKLRRAYQTRGWISADFHSHSSPSGDNIGDQRGRVINLICEQIDFAPCTEHNRVDSYLPHLKALKATRLLGTCTGIELTGQPLPLNHQNAFPVEWHPRTQDGGGPLTDNNPTTQIKRLAGWGSLKWEMLVQQNHPDIGWLFFDKNGDGKMDEGYKGSFPYMHVVEVHPIHEILKMEPVRRYISNGRPRVRNNTIFNWLQILNQGHRIPGVVNTDAHYNYHGSGGLRNFIRCDTKIAGHIDPLDIVHHSKRGHVVMSNGPFMTVDLDGKMPGDDLKLGKEPATLKVRVSCPNWFDVNRVQVLINGRPDPKLNFTRRTHPKLFRDKALRFAHSMKLQPEKDAHVIVVAVDERKALGEVVGPMWGRQHPIAVSNPIYIDVDDNGFQANGDTLGHPLPTKSGTRKEAK